LHEFPSDILCFSSITIGVDGLPIISYCAGNLKVAHCDNITCTSGTATTLDSDGNVGPFTSITIAADRLPIISYEDGTNDDLKITRCSNALCVP